MNKQQPSEGWFYKDGWCKTSGKCADDVRGWNGAKGCIRLHSHCVVKPPASLISAARRRASGCDGMRWLASVEDPARLDTARQSSICCFHAKLAKSWTFSKQWQFTVATKPRNLQKECAETEVGKMMRKNLILFFFKTDSIVFFWWIIQLWTMFVSCGFSWSAVTKYKTF